MFKSSKKIELNLKKLSPSEEKVVIEKSKTALLWLGIVSIIMLFAGLTSGYIVRRGEGDWIVFDVPAPFYTSTGVIILSSATMYYALLSVKKNNKKGLIGGLLSTLILGILFFVLQWQGWKELVANGVFFVGNPSGSFFYVLTGLHLAHLIGGLIFLIWVLFKAFLNKYNPDNYLGVRNCNIYWHFLDILWVYLFLFLIFIR
jgi:cytochrome c oxidase subunit 3